MGINIHERMKLIGHKVFQEKLICKMPRLTIVERNHALGVVNAGMLQQLIAHHFNIHPASISRLLDRVRMAGSISDRPRPGTPGVTTARQDWKIRLQHLHNQFQSA